MARLVWMGTSDDVIISRGDRERPAPRSGLSRVWRSSSLTGGGTHGNAQLTAVTGAILIVLLAAIGFTIPQLRQFIWMHLFLGFVLIGPVLLKMAATGYRFLRYYTHDVEYRKKGPPEILLRLLAPLVVVSTVGVFATGVGLIIDGPADRNPMLLLHKVTFIVWLVFTSLHILGHLPATARALGVVSRGESEPSFGAGAGAAGRWITLTGAIVGGLVLALVLIPEFAAWTGHGVFVHHHNH